MISPTSLGRIRTVFVFKKVRKNNEDSDALYGISIRIPEKNSTTIFVKVKCFESVFPEFLGNDSSAPLSDGSEG